MHIPANYAHWLDYYLQIFAEFCSTLNKYALKL